MKIATDDDVIGARQRIRMLATEVGFAALERAMLAAVVTELARNLVEHAGGGEVLLHPIEEPPRRGISVVARDQGPGIPDIKEAIRASYSVAGGLGLGLKGVQGLMDTLEIISVPGSGTTVTARKWTS